MRKLFCFLCSALFFFSFSDAYAQNRQLPAAILQQMASSMGWSPANLPNDLVATFNLTLNSDDGALISKTVVFKARGTTQFRWDYSDTPGRSTIVDLSTGRATSANGLLFAAQSGVPWVMPFLGSIRNFTNQSMNLEYLGAENVGEQAYKVRLTFNPDPNDPRADEIQAGSEVVVWVSATTFLPMQVEYQVQSFTNRLSFSPRYRRYSNYQTVQGILIPMHQEVWSEDQKLYSIDLTGIQFNVGLQPSDFQTSQTGGQ